MIIIAPATFWLIVAALVIYFIFRSLNKIKASERAAVRESAALWLASDHSYDHFPVGPTLPKSNARTVREFEYNKLLKSERRK
jgi:hypothetical protein